MNLYRVEVSHRSTEVYYVRANSPEEAAQDWDSGDSYFVTARDVVDEVTDVRPREQDDDIINIIIDTKE